MAGESNQQRAQRTVTVQLRERGQNYKKGKEIPLVREKGKKLILEYGHRWLHSLLADGLSYLKHLKQIAQQL